MRTIRVLWSNGDYTDTEINGTQETIRQYYVGRQFNIGNGEHDNMQTATDVLFIDKTYPAERQHRRESSKRTPIVGKGTLVAALTGEFRQPKAGEWYLSGAIPEAYYAGNDISTAFHIAKLTRL